MPIKKEHSDLSSDQFVDLMLINDQLEAHRMVLAWLINNVPNNEGLKFLSCQANLLEKNDKLKDILEELDKIREYANKLHFLSSN